MPLPWAQAQLTTAPEGMPCALCPHSPPSPTPNVKPISVALMHSKRTRFKNVSFIRINSFRGKPVSRHNLNLQFTMWGQYEWKALPKNGKKFTMSTSLWFCSPKKKKKKSQHLGNCKIHITSYFTYLFKIICSTIFLAVLGLRCCEAFL